MKKWSFLATAAVVCVVAGRSHAQWSSNGNKIYYDTGKVGIGTSNPNSALQIVSSIGASERPTLLVKNQNEAPEADNAVIKGVHRSMTSDGIGVVGEHDGNGWGVYGVVHGGGSGGVGVLGRAFGQGIAVRGIAGVTGYAGYFNGRTYVNGRLGVGVPEPDYDLHLQADSAAKPTSNTWTIDSDRRLKKNIRPIGNALNTLLALHGVTYQWKDPAAHGHMAGTYTGMIAQDVERVFPEWVREKADGYKTLTVIGFEGIVVEALRELRMEKDLEIDVLRAENETLRDELAQLRADVEALKAAVQK